MGVKISRTATIITVKLKETKRQKFLRELGDEMKRRLKKKQENPTRVVPRAPRYDDVFVEGQQQLDQEGN